MTDIVQSMTALLSNSWNFLMKTFIPGTEISFAVLFIGLAMVPLGFGFLSLAMGHSVGETGSIPDVNYGSRASKRLRISDGRKGDVK